MKSNKLKLSIAALSVLITACSSTPSDESLPYGQGYKDQMKGERLFALLEKGNSGHYAFTKFSTEGQSGGPWVDLRDLTPLFGTSDISCETAALLDSANHAAICNDDEESLKRRERYFKYSTVDAGDIAMTTAVNAVATAFTFGIAALGVKGHYTVAFDQDAYQDAINEAKKGLDVKPIVAGLAKFDTDVAQSQLVLDGEIKSKTDALNRSLKVKFIDSSKIFGKLDSRAANVVVDSYQTPLRFIRGHQFSQVQDLYDEVDAKIAEQKQNLSFSTDCNLSFLNGWNYSISGCDDKVGFSDSKMGTVTITVKSKKEFYVPYLPTMNDSTVLVKSENGLLTIHNKTGKYLKVDSVSMYVGKDIETFKNLDVEVPPEAVSNVLPLNRFYQTEKRRKLYNVDLNSLRNPISLGAAVKYRITDTNREKTLYKVDSVKPIRYF